ncbi:radical SAM family heme chaperone HemW [Roseibacterium sp. SDUM158016]|uniref:radical SAM family heme chaperone HemW n=1 Tax=Roseicyclus sediminis TaxID=2980997 RepID=UPI0021CE4F92|nr:radical SAM family heme chaperone HemW [Roseibacterium sp. SDUM158016]MCU4652279.1 radical SAM family heme chaperone HemW [Roseibacterium sp. SDUM158016]
MAETPGDFGLYIHWPFCQAKCPYCDFNSHVAASIDHDRWLRAYLSEIDRLSSETGPRTLRSIFFGGGTPSLMSPDTVAAVLDAARAAWPWANDVEITLEANPTSTEAGRFRGFREAGVNRVSVGVQALNDTDLKRLGRLHSATEARAAFDLARETFPRVSFDLIYARQDQTPEDWRRELAQALSMAADHLSLYQLTIEPGTAFGDRFDRGLLRGLPDEDAGADMYEITQDLCGAAGLPAYEVSNHAHDGAQSRHNLIYWQSGDWGGIGPGAHGRLTLDGTRWATATALSPAGWLTRVETDGTGETERTAMSPRERGEEYLMMGLRLAEGVDLSPLATLLGDEFPLAGIKGLEDLGLVERDGTYLRTTRAGRPVLNAILRELLA